LTQPFLSVDLCVGPLWQ